MMTYRLPLKPCDEPFCDLYTHRLCPGMMSKVNFIDGKHHGVKVQSLLSEFYLHNFVLEEETEKNPSPFVGDVQFQVFISFAVNQLKWFKAHNMFQR